MIVLKRGMVIDINLDPTKSSETGKIRPCVVVTNYIYNERVPVIQVVPIIEWSAKKTRIKTNKVIEQNRSTTFQQTIVPKNILEKIIPR